MGKSHRKASEGQDLKKRKAQPIKNRSGKNKQYLNKIIDSIDPEDELDLIYYKIKR